LKIPPAGQCILADNFFEESDVGSDGRGPDLLRSLHQVHEQDRRQEAYCAVEDEASREEAAGAEGWREDEPGAQVLAEKKGRGCPDSQRIPGLRLAD